MAQPDILEISGLQLSNNTFSASPPGSLSVADNIIIDQKGVAEPRNGQAYVASPPSSLTQLPFSIVEFQEQMIVGFGTSKTDTAMGLGYVNGSTVSAYAGGPYNPPGDNGVATDYGRMKFCLASLFLHFACASGPKCLETYNGTPRMAGLSRMPDPFWDLAGTSVAGLVLPYNSSVAYRTVLRRATSSGVSLLSPVSNRTVATNRLLAPVGGLVRTGGNTVTATILSTGAIDGITSIRVGDTFTLTPGEANFAAASYTVTARSVAHDGVLTIQWTDVGANVNSTVPEDLDVGTMAVDVVSLLPQTAVAGDFLRIYRSLVTSDSTIEPSDDLYLSNEVQLAASDITLGFISVTDNTPQSVLSDPLYTNPSDGDGQGIDGSNFQPPIYGDVCNFDGGTWYTNTTGQQALHLQMLGIGGPNGIQDGDTLTIDDGVHTTTLTFKTTAAGGTQVQIFAAGTPSENISMTSAYLSTIIPEQTLPNGIGIYADTSPNGFPGRIIIERWDFGSRFSVKASRPLSWFPALDPTTPTYSTDGAQPNGLCNSKAAEPEAVPPVNFRTVGVANYYVRRIFGLRNALIILKEGDGIWSLTGSGGNYSLLQISTANIIAPDCAAVFADCVWAYTDQGVLRISDSGGAQVVSRPIDTELNRLADLFPDETYAWSFAVAYETARRIMFYVPVGAYANGVPKLQAFCYSIATNAWTKFNAEALSGVVSTAHKLWLGQYLEAFAAYAVTEERKVGDFTDKADLAAPIIVTAVNVDGDASLIQLEIVTGIVQGCGLTQNDYRSKVAGLRPDVGPTVVELVEPMSFVVGTAVVDYPYAVEIQFLPAGSPGQRKTLTRLFTAYKPASFANLYGSVTLETDQIQDELLVATPFKGFGLTPFGQGSFGNPSPMTVDSNPIDPKWANAGQFFPGFKLNEVWASFRLQGLGMRIEGADAPVGRGT